MKLEEMLGKEIVFKEVEGYECDVKGIVVGIDEDSFEGLDLLVLANVEDMILVNDVFEQGLNRGWVELAYASNLTLTTEFIRMELGEDLIPVWTSSDHSEVL